MKRHFKLLIIGAVVLAIAAGGAGVAVATSGDDSKPITGAALQQASAAALQATGGGKVTGTEVGDEESYYEVEVTGSDGSQTDVRLDRDFKVVGEQADQESSSDTGN